MSSSSIIRQLQCPQVQYLLFGITCVGVYSILRMWPNYTKHCKACRKRLAGMTSSKTKHRHGDQQREKQKVMTSRVIESSV